MEFKDLVQLRRSHRKFTAEEIDAEDVKLILRAGLMAPTSKGQRAWQFVVVDDKADLEKLADAKDMGGQFLKDAPLAVVVLGDPVQNDCWVEDGSIAAISMQYQIEALGLDRMPVCMAKTQYSLSDDPNLLGRPTGYNITVREVYVSAGAGFVVALTGAIMTMPGLPKHPAAYDIDLTDDGKIVGLF